MMNTPRIDCTGSNSRPEPAPLDGSTATGKPLRSALFGVLALCSLSMVTAFSGAANAQVPPAYKGMLDTTDCVTVENEGSNRKVTNGCTNRIKITGKRTRVACGDLNSEIPPAGQPITLSDTPLTYCIQYNSDQDQYDSGYKACDPITGCGVGTFNEELATKLPTGDIQVPLASNISLAEGGTATMTVSINLDNSTNTNFDDIVVNFTDDSDDVTISPTSLTFTGGTGGNWSTAQTVTLTAAEDSNLIDDFVVITAKPRANSGVFLAEQKRTVKVTDNDDDNNEVRDSPRACATQSAIPGATEGIRFTNNCGKELELVGHRTQRNAVVTTCSYRDTDFNDGGLADVKDSEDPQRYCIQYTSPDDRYATGYKACPSITSCPPSGRQELYAPPLPTGTLTLGAVGTLNEGGTATMSVSLSLADSSLSDFDDVVVNLSSSDSTKVTLSASSLTFTDDNYQTAQSITLTAAEDSNLIDDFVTITATLDSASGVFVLGKTQTAKVTDNDDDNDEVRDSPRACATQSNLSGNTGIKYTNDCGKPLEMVGRRTGEVSRACGERETTFNASGSADVKNSEDPQQYCIQYADDDDQYASGYKACDAINECPASGRQELYAPPLPTGTLTLGAVGTLNEGGTATMSVSLSLADSSLSTFDDVDVNLSSNNSDVTLSASSVTFTDDNHDTAQSITLTAGQDNDLDDDSVTITATLKNTSGVFVLGKTQTATVTDDDDNQTIELSSTGELEITEGSSATPQFRVKLGGEPDGDVTLSVTSSDTGAATVSPATLTFTSDNYETLQPVNVTPVDDEDGTDESLNITISATSGYDDAPDVTKPIKVVDDDGSIEVDTGLLTLTEGGDDATFTVTLGAPPASSATISVTSGDTGAVTVSPATLTFAAATYDRAQTVTVTPVDDTGVVDELVTITLAATAGYTASNKTKRIRVVDDEPPPFDGTFVISPTNLTVEEGEDLEIEITLSKAPTGDFSLVALGGNNYPFRGGGIISRSQDRSDFTTSNWDDAITLTVATEEDNDYDDLVFGIRLIGRATEGRNRRDFLMQEIEITLEDDDTPPSGNIIPSSLAVNLTEGGASKTFNVSIGGDAPVLNVVVSVTSRDTGALTVSPASLTFTPSNYTTPQSVTVTPVDDSNSDDENVDVDLAISNNAYTAAAKKKAIFIADDEESSVDFGNEEPLTIREGGSATISVSLGGVVPTENVVVTLSSDADVFFDTDPNTEGDQNTLTFTPRNSTVARTVIVKVGHDDDAADKDTDITLLARGGITADARKTLTIIDDDKTRIEVTHTGTFILDEGDSGEMSVYIGGNAPTSNVTVTLSNDNADITIDTDPDRTGDQATLTFTPANAGVPQAVLLKAVKDSDKTDDTATVTLQATGGLSETKTVAVDLREQAFEFSDSGALSLVEGASRDFSFALATQPTGDVEVSVTKTNGDITVSPQTLSFDATNWSTARNITVSAAEDSDPDNDSGTVILTASGSGLNGRTGVKVIEVDDNDDIRFSVDTVEVDEEGEATFTVRLWRQPAAAVNLSFSNENEDVAFDVDSTVEGNQNLLSFTTSNWDAEVSVRVTAARDIDANDDTDTITVASQNVSGAFLPVRVKDTTFTVVKAPAGGLTLAENAGQTIRFALDKPPTVERVEVRLSNDNPDITFTPRMLIFTPSNWNSPQGVRIFARDDNDTDDDADIVTIAATGVFNRHFEVSVVDPDREIEEITAAFVLSPTERMVIVEGRPSYLYVHLNGRPTSEVIVDLQRTNPRLSLRPPQVSFGPATWKDPVVVRVMAQPDPDTVSDTDTITVAAEGFPDTRIAVEVIDETGFNWPIKARALAFPPATVHDSATMRVRCNQDTACSVHFDCNAQDGSPFSGEIPNPIPPRGTITLSNSQIAEIIGGTWAGKGRLGCNLRSTAEIGTQIWTRSGDGVLVNNSAFLASAQEGDMHRVDIESISSPGNAEKSNLRIRCISPSGVRCQNMNLACYDDEGERYDGVLGSLLSGAVLHLQSESLSSIISHRWRDMSLACELRSNHPFTVQVLTRTGGGGALVNNSASGTHP